MVERDQYAAYLKAVADARQFEKEFSGLALDILCARYPWLDDKVSPVRFTKDSLFVDDATGHTYGIRAELLFDPLWKEICKEALRQERNRLQSIAELSERAELARVKKEELEQLAALVMKYPTEAKEATRGEA